MTRTRSSSDRGDNLRQRSLGRGTPIGQALSQSLDWTRIEIMPVPNSRLRKGHNQTVHESEASSECCAVTRTEAQPMTSPTKSKPIREINCQSKSAPAQSRMQLYRFAIPRIESAIRDQQGACPRSPPVPDRPLKSMTRGMGSFVMEYSHDDPAPSCVQRELIALWKPRGGDEE